MEFVRLHAVSGSTLQGIAYLSIDWLCSLHAAMRRKRIWGCNAVPFCPGCASFPANIAVIEAYRQCFEAGSLLRGMDISISPCHFLSFQRATSGECILLEPCRIREFDVAASSAQRCAFSRDSMILQTISLNIWRSLRAVQHVVGDSSNERLIFVKRMVALAVRQAMYDGSCFAENKDNKAEETVERAANKKLVHIIVGACTDVCGTGS